MIDTIRYKILEDKLNSLKEENRLRSIPKEREGEIDLYSNDYMGLGARFSEFVPEFQGLFPDASMTSSASRLLSGNQKYHLMLERRLSELYGNEALLFNSGYHANVGIIQALASAGAVFVCDKLIHASVIDGLRLGEAKFVRFRHNDVNDAEKKLKFLKDEKLVVLVTESIFSMDGDEAPLIELVELKRIYTNTLLYVDEAHAFGVRGKLGLGVASESNLLGDIDILIGTFGKGCASSGAFVACNEVMKSFLLNSSRSFIFSTALPPANAAWTLLMIEKLSGMDTERGKLKRLSELFRNGVEEITGETNCSRTQIVPLVTHDARKAIELSSALSSAGFKALPIRRPTVPPGGERIRFSLNSSLSEEEILQLLETLKRLWSFI